jgi:hypothetical protein
MSAVWLALACNLSSSFDNDEGHPYYCTYILGVAREGFDGSSKHGS